jgi:low density lipoprotein-related protein 2
LASSQSVSFRQGTNVEFGSNTFNANGGGGTAEPLDVAYSLDPISNKNRDFHNPMYDAVQNNADSVGNGSSGNFLI